MTPWSCYYLHWRDEDTVHKRGLNLQWSNGPRIAWVWVTKYHTHCWSFWIARFPRPPGVRPVWRVFAEYDDLDNWVRMVGHRFPPLDRR